MKYLKIILAVILVIAAFIGAFVGSNYLFSSGTTEFDTEKLAVFDEDTDCYYLKDVDSNIKFRINTYESSEVEYVLVDEVGEEVSTKTERISSNSYSIVPPKGGYNVGERYTLTLSDNARFHHTDLTNARKLVFSIKREAIEHYKFTDKVVEVEEAIKSTGEDTIDISNLAVKVDDIVFGKDENGDYVVYKIINVAGDEATVDIPAIDEVYAELDVYGKYNWDVEEIAANPELEVEIAENFQRSDFYNALMVVAYADDSTKYTGEPVKVKITPDGKTNSLKVDVTLTLKPGKEGLFGIKDLKYYETTIVLSSKTGLTTECDINGVENWDIAALLKNDFSWKVNIAPITGKLEGKDELKNLFSDKNTFANLINYHKNVQRITDKLSTMAADASAGEIKLFDWKLPVPAIPGLHFSAEIKLFAELKVAANITVGNKYETCYTVGLSFRKSKFEPYSNISRKANGIELSLSGKANAKAGIKLVVKATLISDKLANISVDPQAGLYADLYVTFPISTLDEINDDNFMYSYFEPGVYFSADFKANLNLLIKKFEFTYELIEKKFPINPLGNKKIAMGIKVNAATVRANNNMVPLPDILFEHYDVKKSEKATEKLKPEKLKFTGTDGEKLESNGNNLILPAAVTSDIYYVTASYTHTDGKSYNAMFRVLISGSILEGKVSAYTPEATSEAVVGATVALYARGNNGAPISTLQTDESGQFAFNVSEGEYRLVISAEGYHSLESNQSVGDDEIKYTEHMLLIDDDQSGMGSAGGIVANALDGRGLDGVRLRLRNEWNTTAGAYYDYETTTSESGEYLIQGISTGYYTVEASLSGYVTGYANIIVVPEGASDFDFTITPELNENEVRVVLTWGATPSDLDSHLIGKTPAGEAFNVFYSNQTYMYNSVEMANLDVDDTTSYGPETITILENINGIYTYAVHDFSNRESTGSEELGYSGAIVRVFVGSNQIAEYHVPTGQTGTYWTVFQIDEDKQIVPINTVSNTKPEA